MNDVVAILTVLCLVELFIIIVAFSRILHWKSEWRFVEKVYHNCRVQMDRAYRSRDELARELKTTTDCAISFIRNPESSRGYDPNTYVGRIAQAAFLKWIRSKEAK